MKHTLENFTEKYQVNKTLRFALHPVGKTEYFMEERKIREHDLKRSEEYGRMKGMMDKYYKEFIEKSLINVSLDWTTLFLALGEAQKSKDDSIRKTLKNEQDNFRKAIRKCFEEQDEFKLMFKKEMITQLLPQYIEEHQMEPEYTQAIELFSRFTVYFNGFFGNRNNVFSSDEISTSIAYRLVNDNFPMYVNNMNNYQKMLENSGEIIEKAFQSLIQNEEIDFSNEEEIRSYFQLDGYNLVLTQSGITKYNQIIASINLFGNLYKQQNPELKLKKDKVSMTMLHKQILSDRILVSFLPEKFESDAEVLEAIREFEMIIEQGKCFEKSNLLCTGIQEGTEGIYISRRLLSEVSMKLFGNWSYLSACIRDAKKQQLDENPKQKQIKQMEKELKEDAFDMCEIDRYLIMFHSELQENSMPTSVFTYFDNVNVIIEDLICKRENYKTCICKSYDNLLEERSIITAIKEYMDAYQELLHYFKVFDVCNEYDKNYAFYAEMDEIYGILKEIVPLYNAIRNYLTRKPYSEEKYKLNFDRSDFFNGWAQDFGKKESMVFEKNGKYYLCIIDEKLQEDDISSLTSGVNTDNQAIRYIYDFQKPDNKNIPRLFIRSKGDNYAPAVEKYQLPINSITEIYDKGLFKTEQKKIDYGVYRASLESMIDYFKMGFQRHESYKHFNFQWKESSAYDNIAEFYKDVENSCYELRKEICNFDSVKQLVEEGKIYLFQIYNKDFSDKSSGTDNLHTIYWKALFSEENLRDTVIKLNGQAELFYREPSIHIPIIHDVGKMLVNRTDTEGNSLSESVYNEIYKVVNGLLPMGELSNEAKSIYDSGKVVIKPVKHQIVKDRRYTKSQYLFHVPITINFKQPAAPMYFNDEVRAFLKNNPDVNIIGLDRGERNLIYMSIIDQKGKILLRKSFNCVTTNRATVDYHEKLEQRENERNEKRKNWDTIGNIRNLKEGYLSQAVHEITRLMIEYNAIIVMEELNYGFKRERIKFEKQVYQKFEKMLIDKLNYLVFKTDVNGELTKYSAQGGVLKGYQLTDAFTSFAAMRNQSGFLFYVPAKYTSRIDPATGFVNIFDKNSFNTDKERREFVSQFDEIRWNEQDNEFLFMFNYDKFRTCATSYRKEWVLSSKGERLINIHDKAAGKAHKEVIIPQDRICELLDSNGITFRDEKDLRDRILQLTGKHLDEFIRNLRYILEIRNSKASTGEDYIFSPVKNNGTNFDSRKKIEKYPFDADENGAYHIALKGLMYLQKINEYADDNGRIEYKDMSISTNEWLEFAQKRSESER